MNPTTIAFAAIGAAAGYLASRFWKQTPASHLPYEGAGFLLTRTIGGQKYVLLGQRIGKDTQTPTGEYEYMGGKPDPEDGNRPAMTAFAEACEELGGQVFDADWQGRARVVHILQPVSQKWIWCYVLDLNDREFIRLSKLACDLETWPINETRDFSAITGRTTPVRKALASIGLFPYEQFLANNKKYSALSYALEDSMKATKAFSAQFPLTGKDIVNREEVTGPLRAFNYMVLSNHLE